VITSILSKITHRWISCFRCLCYCFKFAFKKYLLKRKIPV